MAGVLGEEVLDNVLVLGMGGSGMAGDVLAAIAAPFVSVPMLVAKGYAPPSFVGPGTLCFAVSYSGNTEETVEAAQAAAAAQRWKAQVNENAKAPAFAATIPELCHNEICGWGQHGDVTRQVFTLVELRHDEEHPQELRRFELVRDIMAEVVHDVIEVRAVGEGPLAQLFDLTLVGDMVSLHMAAQEGIDPGPIPVLDAIKGALAG